jgi:hypothetical protein
MISYTCLWLVLQIGCFSLSDNMPWRSFVVSAWVIVTLRRHLLILRQSCLLLMVHLLLMRLPTGVWLVGVVPHSDTSRSCLCCSTGMSVHAWSSQDSSGFSQAHSTLHEGYPIRWSSDWHGSGWLSYDILFNADWVKVHLGP